MIVHVAPRLAPYSFDLAVGELVTNLGLALTRLGNEVVLFVPYGQDLAKVELKAEIAILRVEMDDEIVEELWLKSFVTPDKLKVYVLGDEKFLTDVAWEGDALVRATVFSQGVLTAINKLGLKPKVINGFGWESAPLMSLLKGNQDFAAVANVLTISEDLGAVLEQKEIVKSFKNAVALADEVVLSSSKYAGEIFDPHPQDVLASLLLARQKPPLGILGGLDYKTYDPRQDKLIEHNFDEGLIKERPKNKAILQKETKLVVTNQLLLAVLGPLTEINGGELLLQILPGVLEQGIQVLVAGQLTDNLKPAYQKLAKERSGQLVLRPDLNQEQLLPIMAGSDVLLSLVPFGSHFPYSALIALRYGCVPLVFASGTATEIIEDYDPNRETGNGFVFNQYSPWALFAAIIRARELARFPYDWQGLQDNGMQSRFFWAETARQYVDAYRTTLARKAGEREEAQDEDEDEEDGPTKNDH